jgi:hypothetical protein
MLEGVDFSMSFELNEMARIKALADKVSALDTATQAATDARAKNIVQNEFDKAVNNSSAIEYAKLMQEEDQRKRLASQYPAGILNEFESAHALIRDYENATNPYKLIAEFENNFSDKSEMSMPTLIIPAHHIQENPIHTTNRKLEKVLEQSEKSDKNLHGISNIAVDISEKYSNNLKQNKISSRFNISVAILALIVSALSLLVAYESYLDTKEANKKSELQSIAVETKISNIAASQKEDRIAIEKAISDNLLKLSKEEKK